MDLSDTDWNILEQCSQNRETRSNLAVLTDVTPNYVSREVAKLTDKGLLRQPGPAEKSGMYVTTLKGNLVLKKRSKYEKQHSELFESLVTSSIEIAERLSSETEEQTVEPADVVITSVDAYDVLHSLRDKQRFTHQSAKEASSFDNIYAVYGILYELYFLDLLDRVNEQEYQMTERGYTLIEETTPPVVTVDNLNRAWNALPTKRE
jgi:DNA-binding MarR family transcriptional regulator